MTFNGSSWTSALIDPSPTPTSQKSYLMSVSCASASFCVAVDWYGRELTFNGQSWSAPNLILGYRDPSTGVVYYDSLTSVSCPSASFCVAMGVDGQAMTFSSSASPPPPPTGGGGGTPSGGGTPGGGTTTPQATALSVSPHTFALTGRLVKGRCAAASRANRTRRRCIRSIALRISVNLNIPSRVTFTIKRATTGKLVKGGCLAPTLANRRNRSCTRLITVHGSFTRSGNAGKNGFTFNGRIGGRNLTLGSYRLTATPISNGRTGNPQSISFQIVL